MPAPAGTMGYTHSDGETLTLSRYGPGVETASSSAARSSRGLSMVLPVKPYAPASLAASGIHTLRRRNLHVEQVRPGRRDRLFERRPQFARALDGSAGEAVRPGQFGRVWETIQLHRAQAVVV